MKKGVLFIGGQAPLKKYFLSIIKKSDIIVAADSGLEHAYISQIHVDKIVGDMDSLTKKEILLQYDKKNIERYPQDKDETDTEIGVRRLFELGCDQVTIIGGGGGRLDHLLGILSLFHRKHSPSRWLTDLQDIILIEGTMQFSVSKGEILSFFPMGKKVCTMMSKGLKWKLDGLEWSNGDFGISNEAVSEEIEITMKSGKLIMVKELNREFYI